MSFFNYSFYINGELLESISSGLSNWVFKIANIIPSGATYRFEGTNIALDWLELR